MENIFLLAGFISIIFLIFRFVEMRFIDKENKPLKVLIKESLLVYFSVIIGDFIIGQLKPVLQDGELNYSISNPAVFTGSPGF
jgi:ACR3 family arsenite efflux pump ArsB